MKYQDSTLAELLAAEYVLGTLQGPARRRFEHLLDAHPALRRRVQEWELRLNELAHAAPAVTPPARTWNAIQQRLFAIESNSSGFARLRFWRLFALGNGLLAGVLAVLLWFAPGRAPLAYLVMISDPASQQTVWLASTSADMGHFYIHNMKPLNMPPDTRCVLWLRPEGSQQVYPLGVLPDRGDTMTLAVDKTMRTMLPGQLLVTMESAGGSSLPLQPSQPPLYEGKWMSLKDI